MTGTLLQTDTHTEERGNDSENEINKCAAFYPRTQQTENIATHMDSYYCQYTSDHSDWNGRSLRNKMNGVFSSSTAALAYTRLKRKVAYVPLSFCGWRIAKHCIMKTELFCQ